VFDAALVAPTLDLGEPRNGAGLGERRADPVRRLRLDNRLSVKWDLGDIPRTAKIPVLMLQLLV